MADVQTTARREGDAWILNGDKGVVLHGAAADTLLVTARIAGNRRDHSGIGLFVVDARQQGVTRTGYATQDGLRAAEIGLANARPSEMLAGPHPLPPTDPLL